MRSAALAAVVLTLSSVPGKAEEAVAPTITDACVRAAEVFFADEVTGTADVIALPEATPPRVKLSISRSKVGATLGGNTGRAAPMMGISCEFSAATAPYGLTAFDCDGMECAAIDASRLEELHLLLAREGL